MTQGLRDFSYISLTPIISHIPITVINAMKHFGKAAHWCRNQKCNHIGLHIFSHVLPENNCVNISSTISLSVGTQILKSLCHEKKKVRGHKRRNIILQFESPQISDTSPNEAVTWSLNELLIATPLPCFYSAAACHQELQQSLMPFLGILVLILNSIYLQFHGRLMNLCFVWPPDIPSAMELSNQSPSIKGDSDPVAGWN